MKFPEFASYIMVTSTKRVSLLLEIIYWSIKSKGGMIYGNYSQMMQGKTQGMCLERIIEEMLKYC